jgi:NAD(P)-dependent dehydrogenase (short-subunit alcohol dehydrogenase family)
MSDTARPAEAVANGAKSLFDLSDRAVVLTGASSGLGEHFARVLDAAGAQLLLVARREERLKALASQLRSAHTLAMDLSDPRGATRVVSEAVAKLGGVDVLINNAGTNDNCPALDEPVEDFERVLALNLTTPFVLCREAARVMIESGSGGAIINVASMLGLVGLGRIPEAGYHASKGGLINLTRELAAQWARKGVRVNALAPGWFPSELTAELFDSTDGQAWLRRNTPMGRVGRHSELDGPLLLLASDASSYMTGQVIVVDGGWTAV